MTQIVATTPLYRPRGGRVAAAQPGTLGRTVLAGLDDPDVRVVVKYGDLDIPVVAGPRLLIREVWASETRVRVVYLPPHLAFLDSVVASQAAGTRFPSPQGLLKQLSEQATRVLRARVAGLMRPFLPADVIRQDEVGVSLRDAVVLAKAAPQAAERLKLFGPAGTQAWARGIDGAQAWVFRYPNASSTSLRPVRLRVVEEAPDAILMEPSALIRFHQGDCDGDLGYVVLDPRLDRWSSPEPARLYNVKIAGVGEEDLAGVVAEDAFDPLDAVLGASVRGQYIGLLTYLGWLLGLWAEKLAEAAGSQKAEAWLSVLDAMTPLIEGVMDARKGSWKDADRAARAFAEGLTGKIPVSALHSVLAEIDPRAADVVVRVLHPLAGERGTVNLLSMPLGPAADTLVRGRGSQRAWASIFSQGRGVSAETLWRS